MAYEDGNRHKLLRSPVENRSLANVSVLKMPALPVARSERKHFLFSESLNIFSSIPSSHDDFLPTKPHRYTLYRM